MGPSPGSSREEGGFRKKKGLAGLVLPSSLTWSYKEGMF